MEVAAKRDMEARRLPGMIEVHEKDEMVGERRGRTLFAE